MNRYLKLVHMEISRFWKLYVALLVATLLMQCGGVVYSVRSYISNRKQNMEIELLTDAQYAIKYGAIKLLSNTDGYELLDHCPDSAQYRCLAILYGIYLVPRMDGEEFIYIPAADASDS